MLPFRNLKGYEFECVAAWETKHGPINFIVRFAKIKV